LLTLFATGINDISETSGKFTAVVVDTGSKFAAGVINTSGAP
jgi:hypothetical protein